MFGLDRSREGSTNDGTTSNAGKESLDSGLGDGYKRGYLG